MTDRRRERARELCRRLAADVAAVAPNGVGRWAPAWDLVEAPTKWFLELILAWESVGDPELLGDIRRAYDAVVESWRQAAAAYSRSLAVAPRAGVLFRAE